MENSKTIKELADDLGIDKKKVSYQVTKLDNDLVTKIDGKIYLSKVAISIIKKNIGLNKTGKFTSKKDGILDDFSNLLIAEKEREIDILISEKDFLKIQINELNTLLNQQQQLQLKTQQMLEEKTLLLETVQKNKWWKFWKN